MTDCDCESIYSEKTSLDCCKGHSSFNVQYHVCIMMPIYHNYVNSNILCGEEASVSDTC